jgi:outer membrane protein TolC
VPSHIRHILLATVLAWSPTTAVAETVPLTLAEALQMAEQQNPDIRAALERAEAETLRIEAFKRMSWPRLSLTSGWSRTNNPSMVFAQKLNAGEFTEDDFAIDRLNSPDALNHLMTTLSLEVPIDIFGKVSARVEGQTAAGAAADAATREAVQQLRLHVVQAYRQAALARRAVSVTERALDSARAREADIQARVDEGAALRADLLRARARRREREADLAERRGEANMAVASLARLLGAEPGIDYEAVESPSPPAPLDGDETAWTARATAQRAVIEAAHRKQEATRWAATGEDRGLLPDIAVYGQLQDDRNSFSGGKQTGVFGAMVRWNAFDPGRSKRLAVATAEQRAAEQEARAASDQVRLEVEMAWRRAHAARERYAAAAGGAEEGREALRVVQERRQAGMATLTDELETEVAALAAELREIQAATQAAIADAALRRAAGEL